eukprot:11163225-Lingulodinium_polyedra.AAC.1
MPCRCGSLNRPDPAQNLTTPRLSPAQRVLDTGQMGAEQCVQSSARSQGFGSAGVRAGGNCACG